MSEPIQFHATIAKVQTLADGGIRLTLDLPETAILAAAQLMTVRAQMAVVDAVLTASVPEIDHDEENQRKAKF